MDSFLYNYQEDAVSRMHNGCVLCGGVGSGKSRTGLAYFYTTNGGSLKNGIKRMKRKPEDLYIITTARKRDTREWDDELAAFGMSCDPDANSYSNSITVDSWNNIKKYKDVSNAFFIFDEQRVVGTGAWAKSFIRIAKHNHWIILSATPGDKWEDYISVFVANGYYRNVTEFRQRHLVYSRFSKFPKVERYLETGRLVRLRNEVLVTMDFKRKTVSHDINIFVQYDKASYNYVYRNRYDIAKDAPIKSASELCYSLRRVVNDTDDRVNKVLDLLKDKPKAIVFYNFNYELDRLKNAKYISGTKTAEWNGHEHEQIPNSDRWVYFVQYAAGAEGWNCIETDTIIFFSQNYSYKTMVQAAGRIDRLNSPYTDLYFYHLKTRSSIDMAISKALRNKKKFNESKFVNG